MRVRLIVVQGQGLPEALELDAPNEVAARQQAQALGYSVLSNPSVVSARPWPAFFGAPTPLRQPQDARWDLVVFAEQLRDLLQAGLSVIEALDTLQRGAPGGAAAGPVAALVRQLRDGRTLSAAMAADPSAFPPLLVALVRASELTSDLPQSLARFIEHQQRVAELRHRITSTALYPLLLIGVGGLVLLFLLFYVMPRFARIFEGLSGELPWSAQAMVGWAHLLAGHREGMLIGFVAVGAALVAVAGVPSLRDAALSRLLQWGPLRVVREPLSTYHLARWYRATGMLVQGGIPLPQALALSNALLPAAMRAQGRAVEQAVNDGLSPAAAHAQAGMATPVAEQLMRAGERTGDLGAVLERVAQFHENDVSRRLERGMKVLEPLVMLGIGLGVGLVVVLMYMPIFELASSIQ